MKGSFVPALCLALALSSPAFGQHYAAEKAWQFNNFKDPTFAWDIYRDTFIGIPPDRDPWSSAFDVLFYDQVYESKLSADGNCFGLSLMSLMMLKKGGHLGYCVPVPQYSGDILGGGGPSDAMLRRAINIMHGHQVNLPTLQLMLDVFAQGKNRDGSFAFDAWQQAKMQNDLMLVSITQSLNPSDGGHTLVAYDAQDLGGGNKRIYVYDPNRPWADPAKRTWYTGVQNYVQITGNAWSFLMDGGTTWSGNPASGGNVVITPASVTGPHSRSPASLGDQIIGKVLNELLLTGSGAQIVQVTDADGKRLYKPGTLEMDSDPATGMLTMVPWFPSDQDGRHPAGTVLFHLGGTGSTLNVQVRGGEAGYTLSVTGARSQVLVKALGGRGVDLITLRQPGSEKPLVALENRRGTKEYDVQFLQAVKPKERLHVMRSSRMAVPTGARVELSVADRGNALEIASPGGALQYDLELRTVTKKGVESLVKSGLTQEEGSVQRVRPRDWSNLRTREVLEELRARAPARPWR